MLLLHQNIKNYKTEDGEDYKKSSVSTSSNKWHSEETGLELSADTTGDVDFFFKFFGQEPEINERGNLQDIPRGHLLEPYFQER
jgi:hypothetical protein